MPGTIVDGGMSRTTGHVYHRYQGHKAILAERAAVKAALVVDRGREIDLQPFWLDAPCSCMLTTCEECGEYARFCEQEDAGRARWEAYYDAMPEPEIHYTGKMVAVEWQTESGYRYWEVMDDGMVSNAAWHAAKCGTSLSDVDEPADTIGQ